MNSKDELYYRAIDLLRQLIQTPSVSREESNAAQLIFKTLESNGFAPHRTGNNVWAIASTIDNNKPTILLNSHIDTVKPTESWNRQPFVATEEEGRLYGLGSNDAGASVVALLSTFLHLSETSQPYNLVFWRRPKRKYRGTTVL